MGDEGDYWNDVRDAHKAMRRMYGVNCPRCKERRPKAHPTILLPGQRCKVDRYVDQRPPLTDEQRAAATKEPSHG